VALARPPGLESRKSRLWRGTKSTTTKLEINTHTRTFSTQHKSTRLLSLGLLSNYKYATLRPYETLRGKFDFKDERKDVQAVFLGAQTNFALWCFRNFNCGCREYTTKASESEE
jgi:hypothetical protein